MAVLCISLLYLAALRCTGLAVLYRAESSCTVLFTTLLYYTVQNLCPGGSGEPSGSLADAIEKEFRSFQSMQNQLSAAAVAIKVQYRPAHLNILTVG
jgi:hypothetical protein